MMIITVKMTIKRLKSDSRLKSSGEKTDLKILLVYRCTPQQLTLYNRFTEQTLELNQVTSREENRVWIWRAMLLWLQAVADYLWYRKKNLHAIIIMFSSPIYKQIHGPLSSEDIWEPAATVSGLEVCLRWLHVSIHWVTTLRKRGLSIRWEVNDAGRVAGEKNETALCWTLSFIFSSFLNNVFEFVIILTRNSISNQF